ncbi:MAG: hypothetical protein ACRD3C_22790 [Vicinamibacterales bacterium]
MLLSGSHVWVAQPVGDRVDLAYLGGLAFDRNVEDVSFQFRRADLSRVGQGEERS